MKVRLDQMLRAVEDAAWQAVDDAMHDRATIGDVATAAAAVRIAGLLRQRYGASSAAHENIQARYLASLSLRLMELDHGEDLTAAAAVSALISGKPPALHAG